MAGDIKHTSFHLTDDIQSHQYNKKSNKESIYINILQLITF